MTSLIKAWGDVEDRRLEQIEIIDIRPEDEVVGSCPDFIHTHHYEVWDSIFDSHLGRYLRRTCDVFFDNTMNVLWSHGDNGLKKNMTFEDIEEYLAPLIEDERGNKGILKEPYV